LQPVHLPYHLQGMRVRLRDGYRVWVPYDDKGHVDRLQPVHLPYHLQGVRVRSRDGCRVWVADDDKGHVHWMQPVHLTDHLPGAQACSITECSFTTCLACDCGGRLWAGCRAWAARVSPGMRCQLPVVLSPSLVS
jgi:hypothetical protein